MPQVPVETCGARGADGAGKGTLMRLGISVLVLLAVTACGPTVPDSGVGFENYPAYVRDREAALNGGTTIAPGPVISGEALPATVANDRDAIPAGIARQSGEMQAAALDASPEISDEQEFSAVSSRETIESNAERLARQRSVYTEIAPTALPQRSGSNGPNIVEYALTAGNRLGEQVFRRTNPFREKQSLAACAKFASPDQAQEEFLIRGGPERDGKSLDPDGDGYACAWDPTPFRNAVN